MSKMPRQEICICTPSMVLSTSICRIDFVVSHDGDVSSALALTLEVFQKMSTVPPAPSPDPEPKSLPMAVRLLDLVGCWGQTHEMMSAYVVQMLTRLTGVLQTSSGAGNTPKSCLKGRGRSRASDIVNKSPARPIGRD